MPYKGIPYVEGVKDERMTERDHKMYAGEPGPHASVKDAVKIANRESSYYVDPNTHQSPEAGPQESVDPGKSGDKMVGKDTGGQDSFGGKGYGW